MNQCGVDCWVLTGATGLVGRFVLAELLRSGELVAALVRDRASAPALARIEECLAPFESEVSLLRPRTIAFDLTVPGLGISEADRQWLAGKRLGVIHSAASIRFVATSPNDEPYLSNVEGTRHLLDFLRTMNVACFHYVSTAYVTNRAVHEEDRDRPRMEVAIESGLAGANDYESSKIASERLILECDWIKSKTILRPSIIVGDSRTGYTATFHGFYAPLQIGNQFLKLLGSGIQSGNWFRTQLGIQETDTKNFVPVDWVARSIVRIALEPRLHGSIYHLTNPQPVSCVDIQTAIEQSLRDLPNTIKEPATSQVTAPPASPANFREQMVVYESYFSNDPQFDCTNTFAALPDLPCPKIDIAMLIKMAEFALRVNFGWPRQKIMMPNYSRTLARLASAPTVACPAGAEVVAMQVLGIGASCPLCFAKAVDKWQMINYSQSSLRDAMTVIIGASDFADCIIGATRLADLVAAGRAVCTGKPRLGWAVVVEELDRDIKILGT